MNWILLLLPRVHSYVCASNLCEEDLTSLYQGSSHVFTMTKSATSSLGGKTITANVMTTSIAPVATTTSSITTLTTSSLTLTATPTVAARASNDNGTIQVFIYLGIALAVLLLALGTYLFWASTTKEKPRERPIPKYTMSPSELSAPIPTAKLLDEVNEAAPGLLSREILPTSFTSDTGGSSVSLDYKSEVDSIRAQSPLSLYHDKDSDYINRIAEEARLANVIDNGGLIVHEEDLETGEIMDSYALARESVSDFQSGLESESSQEIDSEGTEISILSDLPVFVEERKPYQPPLSNSSSMEDATSTEVSFLSDLPISTVEEPNVESFRNFEPID